MQTSNKTMNSTKDVQERIVVSLDVDQLSHARTIVDALGTRKCIYKVGLQLLTAEGSLIIRELVASERKVFLDLKLFEIPSSVAAAVVAAGKLGVGFVTVHASGGSKILRSAVEAARPFPKMQILAITVVTSLLNEDLRETGIEAPLEDQVVRLARLADTAGCHGVIASPQEVALLRSTIRPEMLIFTPGAQVANKVGADQARTATVSAAIRGGATHIMLGRALTQAEDSAAVFDSVCEEILNAA
jgi:orotidine-5'-phosphate decarboxylase